MSLPTPLKRIWIWPRWMSEWDHTIFPPHPPPKQIGHLKTTPPTGKNTMDLDSVKVESGTLKAASIGNDPAFFSPPIQARANDYSHVCLKMRLTSTDNSLAPRYSPAFFGGSKRWPESEASSIRFPVSIDGQWHEYDLPVKNNLRWKGIITRLRLDPINRRGVSVEIRQIGLTPNIASSMPAPNSHHKTDIGRRLADTGVRFPAWFQHHGLDRATRCSHRRCGTL